MASFITKIHINKLFHLNDIDIDLDENKLKHLIITGKNGSGKTLLVNAIVELLGFLPEVHNTFRNALLSEKVNLYFGSLEELITKYNDNNFILAFYDASRKSQIIEPKNPTKPVLGKKGKIADNNANQLLNFLSDLKIQEALARNENMTADADTIKEWFVSFENLLKEIFQNPSLELDFNYKNYEFHIVDGDKRYKFTQLSDGYSACLYIVTDLILKMQNQNALDRDYLKHGIVIIDEIETHLHLELQRIIFPILTRIFPNIQFVVTTHSPFVLSSVDNAVAFDLEKKEALEDLTQYSFEALSEGYFGVNSESSYLRIKLDRYKELIEKKNASESEKSELEELENEFVNIPDAVAPQVKAEYMQLKVNSL